MKKLDIAKLFTTALVASALIFLLSACSGGLHGTYTSKGLIAQTFTFDSGNKITMSAFGINANGTYQINNGELIITYSILGINTDWSCKFEQNGNSIFIDGTEFTKSY